MATTTCSGECTVELVSLSRIPISVAACLSKGWPSTTGACVLPSSRTVTFTTTSPSNGENTGFGRPASTLEQRSLWLGCLKRRTTVGLAALGPTLSVAASRRPSAQLDQSMREYFPNPVNIFVMATQEPPFHEPCAVWNSRVIGIATHCATPYEANAKRSLLAGTAYST
jgi:hypothetical protein